MVVVGNLMLGFILIKDTGFVGVWLRNSLSEYHTIFGDRSIENLCDA